jgi:hypothetical protein
MIRRQPAETIALDLQRTIESRAHVFECDRRRQIDDLLRVEMAFELVEDVVRDVDRAERHLLCITERCAFGRGEQRIFLILPERRELLFADSDSAATGSVDVYSKDATDHLRRA